MVIDPIFNISKNFHILSVLFELLELAKTLLPPLQIISLLLGNFLRKIEQVVISDLTKRITRHMETRYLTRVGDFTRQPHMVDRISTIQHVKSKFSNISTKKFLKISRIGKYE